ncbi:MAG: hypothetical protein CMI26_11670 [Opitutae bacterium]|nr:hypothetical protein [Opitutae bacterium]
MIKGRGKKVGESDMPVVAVVPQPEECKELGRGSFGKVILLDVDDGDKHDNKAGVGKHGRASLFSIADPKRRQLRRRFASPFDRPALKLSTEKDGEAPLRREIDIHHRLNLASQCAREHLIQGIPVQLVTCIAAETAKDFSFNAVLMPRMNCSLFRYMRWRGLGATQAEVSSFIRQVRLGLLQLHAMGIVHADLSTANVLLLYGTNQNNSKSNVPTLCLADFGNCRFVGSDMKQFCVDEYVTYLHPDLFLPPRLFWQQQQALLEQKEQQDRKRRRIAPTMKTPPPLPPKANVRFDAWSYGMLACELMMHCTRGGDARIEAWARHVKGTEAHAFMASAAIRGGALESRIEHVASAFARGDSKVRMAWVKLVEAGLCLRPQRPRLPGGGAPHLEATACSIVPLMVN